MIYGRALLIISVQVGILRTFYGTTFLPGRMSHGCTILNTRRWKEHVAVEFFPPWAHGPHAIEKAPLPLHNTHSCIVIPPFTTTMSSSLTKLRSTQPFNSQLSHLIRYRTPRNFTTSQANASRLRQPGEPTGPNEPPSHISTPPSKSPLKVWPIIFIFATGTYLFTRIVEQRKGEGYQAKGPVPGLSPSGKGTVKPSHPH